MSSPGDEQLQRLLESVAQLLGRQDKLEARMAALEAHDSGSARAEHTPAPPGGLPPPLPPPLPYLGPPPLPVAARQPPRPVMRDKPPVYAAPPSPPAQPAQPDSIEATLGLNWVNRVAVITLMFGAAFLFKYGVDNNWFPPVVRIAMGIVAAGVALGGGQRLWLKNQKVFAQGVTGLGLALGYLSIWAASSLYELIATSAAFLLMCGVTAGAAWLTLRYESQAIAVLAMLGAYLTPVVLSTHENHPWILFGYVALVNVGALTLVHARRWWGLEALALAATALLFLGWSVSWLDSSTRPVATVFVTLFYAQFAITRRLGVWIVIQIAAPLALAGVYEHADLPWQLMFVVGGLAVSEARQWRFAPITTLAGLLLPVWLRLANRVDLGDANVAAAAFTAAFALFFLWPPWWNLFRKRELRAPDLWLLVANAATYFALVYHELNPHHHAYMGLFAIGVGVLYLLLSRMFRGADSILALGVALAFAALAVPIQFTGFRVTTAWALEAAGVAWIGTRFNNRWMRLGAGLLFVMVLARLLAIDAWIYSSVTNYRLVLNGRFLAFAVSACSLWLAAKFTRAAVAYSVGHFVLLFGLGLEVAGWVDHAVPESEQASTLVVSLSLLMALYAASLVTMGIVTRTAINRVLGLGLMALVVAKLYLIDVWELGRLFRITAFLALGALLLGVSYLYSRFKPSIEKLWKGGDRA